MNWKYYCPRTWDEPRQVWEDVYLLPDDPSYKGEAIHLTVDAFGDAQNPAHQHLQEQQLLQLIQPNQPNPLGPTHTPLFVFYTDRYVNFSRPKQLLYDTANKAGLEVTVERVFTQRDGTPVIEVVSLQTGQDSAGLSKEKNR